MLPKPGMSYSATYNLQSTPMALDPQLTASQVLHVFHRDELFLFLGSAFTTVGLISLGLLAMRRKFDALLFWLALFAVLYGGRLWMQTGLMTLMVPQSDFFDRLRASATFLTAIPAFLFFQATGFLGRLANIVTYALITAMLCLLLATLLGAPLAPLYSANNIAIICGLIPLVVQSFRMPAMTRDFLVIRSGLLIFAGFALWNNIYSWMFRSVPRVEPFGFAVFLGCLGYVAARRVLERDHQFNEIQKELDIARRIQLSILPKEFPASAHFRIAARYVPMTSVAGDFYDFYSGQDGKAGLLIADVSGHGVPAALIASMVKLAATSQKEHSAHPEKLLEGMNTTLFGNTQSQYVTAAYVHLDAQSGDLRYAAAAHPPMLLLRDGEVMPVEENGLMLALFPSAPYTSTTRTLKAGDRLLLYTDGIYEAENAAAEQFGHDRLRKTLRESSGMTSEETADLILARVKEWSAAQDDDRTVIVCDYASA